MLGEYATDSMLVEEPMQLLQLSRTTRSMGFDTSRNVSPVFVLEPKFQTRKGSIIQTVTRNQIFYDDHGYLSFIICCVDKAQVVGQADPTPPTTPAPFAFPTPPNKPVPVNTSSEPTTGYATPPSFLVDPFIEGLSPSFAAISGDEDDEGHHPASSVNVVAAAFGSRIITPTSGSEPGGVDDAISDEFDFASLLVDTSATAAHSSAGSSNSSTASPLHLF